MHGRNRLAAGFAALGAVLCGTVLAFALDGGAFSYRDFPEPPTPRLVDEGARGAVVTGRLPDLPAAGRRRQSVRPEPPKRLVSLRRLRGPRPAVGRAPGSSAAGGGQPGPRASSPSPSRGRGRPVERVRRPSSPDEGAKRPRPVPKAQRPALPQRPGPPDPTPPTPVPRPVTAPARDSMPAASDHPARLGPRKTLPGKEPPEAGPAKGEGPTVPGGEGGTDAGGRPPLKPAGRKPLD